MSAFRNASLLIDRFGSLPSFHDAEIRAVRMASPGDVLGSLEVDVELSEVTNETDAAGLYVVRNQCVVTFRFDGVAEARVSGFNSQNVLDDIEIAELSPEEREAAGPFAADARYRVRFVPVGRFCEIVLLCASARVTAVEPLPEGASGDGDA